MTTRPKTRTAPAAECVTPKNSATVASSEPKREVSKIYALVSRWKWLKADADYQAATADTEEKSERLFEIHDAFFRFSECADFAIFGRFCKICRSAK